MNNSESIREILRRNTKNIFGMWERICSEVHTPPLKYNKTAEELKKTYKEIPIEILEHNEEQRLEYVIKERNKIIREELGSDYVTLANMLKDEEILDICKLVLCGWLDKGRYLEDKLEKYL